MLDNEQDLLSQKAASKREISLIPGLAPSKPVKATLLLVSLLNTKFLAHLTGIPIDWQPVTQCEAQLRGLMNIKNLGHLQLRHIYKNHNLKKDHSSL